MILSVHLKCSSRKAQRDQTNCGPITDFIPRHVNKGGTSTRHISPTYTDIDNGVCV